MLKTGRIKARIKATDAKKTILRKERIQLDKQYRKTLRDRAKTRHYNTTLTYGDTFQDVPVLQYPGAAHAFDPST